jgi:hypothetical protein
VASVLRARLRDRFRAGGLRWERSPADVFMLITNGRTEV